MFPSRGIWKLPAKEAIFFHTDPFGGSDNGRALAQAIVDTIREPLLVLDTHLRVVTASRSFYLKFLSASTSPIMCRQ
jgi:hypothetical protein